MVHPLALMFDAAAHGRFPEPDGRVHVFPALAGGVDALVGFTGTFALTGSVSQEVVDARVPKGEFSIPMSPPFLTWLGAEIGAEAATQDLVFVTLSPGPGDAGTETVELVEIAESTHPRLREGARYRSDVRVYETPDRRGFVVLGRGITRRWEIAYEIDPDARNTGLGRAIAAAGARLLPEGTPVWAQVAPGNAASVRAMIGAGFTPVAAEILFVRTSG